MKRLLALLLFTPCLCGLTTKAADDNLKLFGEGALLLLQGIEKMDKDYLADAAELLSAAEPSEFEDFTVTTSAPDALSDPMILFVAEFCDKVRKQNFVLVPLDPLDSLRNIDSPVSTITRTLAPNSWVTFNVGFKDELSLLAVSQRAGSILLEVGVEGGTAEPLKFGSDGLIAENSWHTGSDDNLVITVSNSTGSPVSFVIAFQ